VYKTQRRLEEVVPELLRVGQIFVNRLAVTGDMDLLEPFKEWEELKKTILEGKGLE
jgi:hypothetical protein